MSLCFYSIKAKLFNKSCRELENEGIKDFTFEQLKNKMSHQGNGNYYKQLINYKGMEFFNRKLMMDYESYKKDGTLLENNPFSEEYFNKLKRYCTTEEEKKIVDDPEWRKWFIDITIKASEEIIV